MDYYCFCIYMLVFMSLSLHSTSETMWCYCFSNCAVNWRVARNGCRLVAIREACSRNYLHSLRFLELFMYILDFGSMSARPSAILYQSVLEAVFKFTIVLLLCSIQMELYANTWFRQKEVERLLKHEDFSNVKHSFKYVGSYLCPYMFCRSAGYIRNVD